VYTSTGVAHSDRIKATETAFDILDYIHDSEGATARAIAEETTLSRQGVYKHLRALEAADAVQNQNGTFVLGAKLAEYGLTVRDRNTIYARYRSDIDDLAVSLDAPVNYWSLEERECLCLYTSLPAEGRENPRNQGDSEPLVDNTPGNTILAEYDSDERSAIVKEYAEALDLEEIRSQIQTVEERGLLIQALANEPDWVSISTAICRPSGEPEGAVEVVMPHQRARGIDIEVHVAGSLLDAVDKIELDIFSNE
jgi:DNA-binding IclR family transcriptional regulator